MDAKDDIKRRLSVEDVVGTYLELKRSGRNFKALSPFGNEKTPSFMVSPDKQIWHDFSANKGGDIFTFVMEMEGVDFVGAMEILARKAGIDLSQYQRGSGETAKLKKRLIEINELALKYYHASLAKNPSALNYLRRQRGYKSETIKDFKLGYAPSQGQALYKFLIKRKFKPEDVKKAGLIVNRRGSWFDMFRGRIMVPLMDGQGQPVGFTARQLIDDSNSPKYINTPQTLIYDKGRHIFGLHLAKAAIREQDSAVLVEGNLDVIASHQAGVYRCVATAGTALTRDQLLQLSRLSTNVLLAFDQDQAGLSATERAIPIAQDVGVSLSIVSMPGGKDPDELISKDPAAWPKALEASVYVMDWLVDHYASVFDISTAQGKRLFSDKLIEIIRRVTDPVETEHYIQVVSAKINVPPDRIKEKIGRPAGNSPIRKKSQQPSNESKTRTFNYIDTFIGLLVAYPETRDCLSKLSPHDFIFSEQQKIIAQLKSQPGIKENDLLEADEYVKIITFRAEDFYGSSSSSARLADAMETARRIAKETKKKQTAEIAHRMREALDSADEKSHQELLKIVSKSLKKEG
ncbi:MAG TPA: DNA primase [Candidatus Saccharimonadales bacterium]